jgi:hypothetical protein
MSDETIEKTFQVTAPARLIISNVRGSVSIQPGETGVIEVRAVKHGNFDNGKAAVEMTQDSDGSVRVETRANDALFNFLSHPPRVDYSVRVPQGIHLDASCVSSTLNVSDLEGVFKLKTISGDMDLAKLTGPFKLGAVSGDITGSQLKGVLDLNTVSGRVRLTESGFPSADASTVSGDLLLQTAVADGPYLFSSVSGSVKMLVPTDTRCNVELNSVSGSIRSSLPATVTSMGHGMKVTQIQGGGAAVRLKSVSGGVSIETEGVPASTISTAEPFHGSMVPPMPPMPSMPGDPTNAEPQESKPEPLTTSEILQRIEKGEMTVDEALKLMKDQS